MTAEKPVDVPRILATAGPPSEWSGGVAGCLSPEQRQAVLRTWRSMSAGERNEVLRKWRKGSDLEKAASQGQVIGGILHALGKPEAAKAVRRFGVSMADKIRSVLLHEPSFTPKALKGKYILPKKVVHQLADTIAGNPELVPILAAPGGSLASAPWIGLNRALEHAFPLPKTAELKTPLQPQQRRVVEKIQREDQPGLVVAHGLGSGKTLSAIAAQDALGMPATVVLPASLRANYLKEQEKHVEGEPPSTSIVSLQQVARSGVPPEGDGLLVVDEAHRLRTPGTKALKALKENEAAKRLLLTGSPFYNHPVDIAPLVNIAGGDRILPEDPKAFAEKYVRTRKVRPGILDALRGVRPGEIEELNPKSRKELGGILGKWVDYQPSSRKDFPEVTSEDVEVPMTKHQLRVYDSVLEAPGVPPWVAAKIKKGLPPSKQESRDLNAFASAARQIANSTRAFHGKGEGPEEPKIQRAFEELKKVLDENERAKGVVYSNYLESGIVPYRERLQQAGIPFGEFTGEMKHRDRDELVKQYNEGKVRALLLSSAGGEGLDLRGTRLMQILDPHWNEEKLKQVEGRGARYKSHADLPEEERNMRVQHFISTRPRAGVLESLHLKKPGMAIDRYLTERSADKARLNNQFRELLQEQTDAEAAAAANAPKSGLHKAADLLVSKEQRQARNRADAHFRSDDPKKWDAFLESAKRRSFVNAVQTDLRSDPKLQRHVDQMNRLLTGTELGKVQGKGGEYSIVRLRGGGLGCTCPDWRYKKSVATDGEQECKHVREWKAAKKTADAPEKPKLLNRAGVLEGLKDEGIPMAGMVLGTALGEKHPGVGPLLGGGMGYAAGALTGLAGETIAEKLKKLHEKKASELSEFKTVIPGAILATAGAAIGGGLAKDEKKRARNMLFGSALGYGAGDLTAAVLNKLHK